MNRTVAFDSGGTQCTARLHLSADEGVRPCVVMGHGFTGTQDQLTAYAQAFTEQGLAVLTFDYRHFGDSGGTPRQVVNVAEQLEDWRSALDLARSLPEIDPEYVSLWGQLLLRRPRAAPGRRRAADQRGGGASSGVRHGLRSVREEIRTKRQRKEVPLLTILRVGVQLLNAAVRDELRARRGRPPYYLPVFAPPGGVAAVIDPDHHRFLARAVDTGPSWRNELAARLFLHPPKYVKGTAERVKAPLLVCVAEHDVEANPRAAADIARAAPRGKVLSYPVGHFDIYEDPWQHRLIDDQARFLRQCLSTGTETPGP